MTKDNCAQALRAFQKRTPFRSYTVALVNGDIIEVDHPEALVTRGGTAVYFAPDGTISLFDHESVSQITDERKATA